ncbi:tetratricopeptide repeat protein [Mucilaginibacter litoreus]|uniref:Tetratricopeptide repeat protein n=1 Tax=Mucilaginibacter litoreus TaxID=1048221 RepID=A0ABW3AQX3_9SPHI
MFSILAWHFNAVYNKPAMLRLCRLNNQFPLSRTSISIILKCYRIAAFAAILLICSCSFEKKTAFNRGMQNLTAKFNILFNANEQLRQKQELYEASYIDDYSELLSVYRDTIANNRDNPDPDMDAVKARANKIISVKEQSRYLGDAYLLLSKANFYDANFFDAIEYANYVVRSFGNQPDLKQEALVYKARALLYINQPAEAKITLDSALININPKKRITADVYASKLQYDINVRDYPDAEEMAKLAIQYSHTNVQELRWTFILAQLQELNNKPADAIASYNKVAKSNAFFDMAFNANLNRIRIEDRQSGVKLTKTARLRSLLKNPNNTDFADQIYYQIAGLQYNAGAVDSALNSYKQSVKSSTRNQPQKGLSFLRMADIYFKDKAQYALAKQYYDSTLLNLPPGYPKYNSIRKKSDNLQLLADKLQIISREDTLQMLAKLDEPTREAMIDKMVDAYTLHSQPTAVSQAQAKGAINVNQAPAESMPYGGNFYFNNSRAISQGIAIFKRIWGNRKLEDNWRRANRAESDITQNNQAAIAATDPDAPLNAAQNIADPFMVTASGYRQDIVNNLPLTPALLTQSNRRIFEAYMDIANFYRDELNDKNEAIAAYKQILARFPDNNNLPAIYYNLYRLYSETDAAQADGYKALLISKYPETPFAKTILDPEYGKHLNDDITGFSLLYNKVYDLYAAKQYAQVITAADALLSQYPNNRYAAQLYYLRAFAAGHQETLDPFNADLQQIVSKYPDDRLITPLVNSHLAYIAANQAELASRKIVLTDRELNDPLFTIPIVYQEKTEYRVPAAKMEIVPDVRKPEEKKVEAAAPVIPEKASEITHTEPEKKPEPVTVPPEQSAPTPAKPLPSIFNRSDSTNYYFVVNVSLGTTNLASSRFGIGQFNRVNFQGNNIRHQLKFVGADNQLIYVGRFSNLNNVKDYARAIIPLMPDIMKVPKDKYSFFIITKENLDKLADKNTLDSYIEYYENNY